MLLGQVYTNTQRGAVTVIMPYIRIDVRRHCCVHCLQIVNAPYAGGACSDVHALSAYAQEEDIPAQLLALKVCTTGLALVCLPHAPISHTLYTHKLMWAFHASNFILFALYRQP